MHSTFLRRSLSVMLPLFSAATAMAVAVFAAFPGAYAANIDAESLLRLPMASAEASPARAVLSSVPFNRFVNLATCNSNRSTCYGRLPRLAANVRWVIQFVSCTADVNASESTFRNFSLQVANATMTKALGFHFIAPTYQSNDNHGVTVHVASQPIVLTVEPNSIVILAALSIGAVGGQCAISGIQQTLG